MKWKDACDEFRTYLIYEKGYQKSTADTYGTALRSLYELIKKDDVQAYTSDDIKAYLDEYHNQKDTTIKKKMITFRQFWRFLKGRRFVDSDITEGIALPKQGHPLPRAASISSVRKLLGSIDRSTALGMRDYCIITMLVMTGLRASELTSLNVSDVNLAHRIVKVVGGKGNKDRDVPFDTDTAEVIHDYMYYARMHINTQGSMKLFVNKDGSEFTRFNLYDMVSQQARKAGAGKITPHMLRHTFATTMLDEGANLRTIQELLGHSDIQTTTIYAEVANKKMIRDYRKYFPKRDITPPDDSRKNGE